MDKVSLRFRFEQRRGHYLVVEGSEDRPLTRRDCDEFQLRMLTACEVPGLLKLEAEEIDGRLSLRYALSGTRMLSQLMRSTIMTMEAYMGALCRLAEALEDCRLYVLDPHCILLDDDRIFVGQAGDQDLRFVYLPIPADEGGSALGLESLIVRWMMQVANPDGKAIQQSLRVAASPEFKPAALSRFARAYLAGQHPTAFKRSDHAVDDGLSARGEEQENRVRSISGIGPDSWDDEVPAADISNKERPPRSGGESSGNSDASGGKAGAAPAPPGWRWFQPVSSDANSMSAWLGDDPDPYDEVPKAPKAPEAPSAHSPDGGRKQVLLLCASFGIIAVAWRWGYAASPGPAGLSLSLGMTVAVLAAAGWLSVVFRREERRTGLGSHRSMGRRQSIARPPESPDAVSEHDADAGYGSSNGDVRAAREVGAIAGESEVRDAAPRLRQSDEALNWHTGAANGSGSWEADRTQSLETGTASRDDEIYYLTWETETQAPPIPLSGASLIIGRSREASGHVDVTPGISRAHLELLRSGEGWMVTDLGSRNGSKLNGEAMVAYESYPLRPDDAIELAGAAVYRLRYGKLRQQAS